jgi:glutamine amidotransferase
MDIVIIDYGMGNLRNVQKAFEHIGVMARVSPSANDLMQADGLILPGVGAFGEAMDNLNSAGLVNPIHRFVKTGRPLLGICLGLQLLFQESEEMGRHGGLGLLPGRVVRFAEGLKVPHIGWNQFQFANRNKQGSNRPEYALLKGIPNGSYAYFVHSFYGVPSDPSCLLATTEYGVEFASLVGKNNVFGAQPHPEKSQEIGLRLLENFAKIVNDMTEQKDCRLEAKDLV